MNKRFRLLLAILLVAVFSGNAKHRVLHAFSGNNHFACQIPPANPPCTLLLSEAENFILIQWSAENNAGINYFEIERKESSGEFKTIGLLMSDNSSATLSFSFKDKITARDLQLHYRIKVVTNDGGIYFSNMGVIVPGSVQKKQLPVFLDETANSIRIQLPGTKGSYLSRLYNTEGRLMMTVKVEAANPVLQIQQLPAGSYFAEFYQPQSGTKYYAQFAKN